MDRFLYLSDRCFTWYAHDFTDKTGNSYEGEGKWTALVGIPQKTAVCTGHGACTGFLEELYKYNQLILEPLGGVRKQLNSSRLIHLLHISDKTL